jgi:MraZ protein
MCEVVQMFRGNHPTRVDEKGRLKLPVDHKRTVDTVYGQNVFFITSRDGQRVEIWPMKEWEAVEAQLADLPASAAKTKLLDAINYWGQVVEFDSAGRLLIPQLLRENAAMSGDVAVIGMQKYLTVDLDSRRREKLKAEPVTDADVEQIGIKGL